MSGVEGLKQVHLNEIKMLLKSPICYALINASLNQCTKVSSLLLNCKQQLCAVLFRAEIVQS